MPDNRTLSSKLDRYVRLEKPVEGRDAANERFTDWQTVIERLSAGRLEKSGTQDENLEGRQLNATEEVYWISRALFGDKRPRASWRLIDEYGGIYELIAPPTEIGRREALQYKTRQIQ